ncbi:0e004db5-227e-4988-afb8-5800afdcfd65 [Thermothielavioides terrestris]|uniref:0e004db5-227e-4988-afb8-5800afdcfd65 n=1 Tax=Thermothielavioides terrestris TaxID=2587410 RepID=A0A3S4D182_9PEZI|nr:0e004db5-227e-4988-afb8-5800afdcfd65 [Thermothielavioides terrestris]
MASHIVNKAQEAAREDYGQAKRLLNEAARSRSYLYPIKGVAYFLSHPALWKPLRSKLVPYLTLYSGVLGSMLFFTYLPQLAVMAFVNGPLAVLTTALLILNESSTITSLISKSYLLQDALLDTFDGTLVARDATDIVAEGRELNARGDSIQRLGKAIKKPFSRLSVNELVRYVMYLPLNFVPVVGTVAFILLQGQSPHSGLQTHDVRLTSDSSLSW